MDTIFGLFTILNQKKKKKKLRETHSNEKKKKKWKLKKKKIWMSLVNKHKTWKLLKVLINTRVVVVVIVGNVVADVNCKLVAMKWVWLHFNLTKSI